MKRIVLPVALILLVLAAILVREQIAGLVYRETIAGGSASTLESIETQADLEVLAVVHRVVFPHDFYRPDLSVYQLLDRIRRADRPAEEVLSRDELLHYRAANLAGELGLATAPGAPGYVVITTIRRYGYSVPDVIAVLPEINDEPDAAATPVTVPPATLLSFEIEDLARDRYPWGTVPLDADGVRAVSGFVAGAFDPADEDPAVLREATIRGRELLQALAGGTDAPVQFQTNTP